jgi:PAS domain S-box-containing protein
MTSKQKYKTNAERMLIIALSALSGLVILLTGSIIQKSFIGVPILDIKSYIIPITYGSIAGGFIGLLIIKLLVSKQILRQEYENMHTILKSINDVIIATDVKKKIICFNNAAERITGLSSNYALNKQIKDILKIHPSKNEDYIDITENLTKGKYKESNNCYLQNNDGKLINISYSAILVNDEENRFFGIIILIRDKTKENKYIETIQESEAKLKSILNSINDLILVIDTDGYYREIAPTNQDLLFLPPEDLKGRNLEEIFPLDIALPAKAAIIDAYENQRTVNIRYSLDFNGKEKYFSANISKFKKGHVIFVIKDITEHIEYESNLIEAKERAEENDNLKSVFLSNLSHEIRTPLNAIIGFTELLKDPDLKSEDKAEYIEHIQDGSERMMTTMNNLINISKIQSTNIKLNISNYSINDSFLKYYYTFEKKAIQKKINFSYNIPEKDLSLNTDAELLDIIMYNLIDNAIKFTDEGSVIFGTEIQNRKIRIFVKDTGIGIDENKDIFKTFEQANTEIYNKYEGIGLGLSIAGSYVSLLGGEISYDSEVGKGTVFYITLPL